MKNQLRFKAVLVLLVSILLLSAQAFAASVTGKVTCSNTGQPVNGAMVIIVGQGGPFTTMTDVNGNYSASTLTQGKTYTITVTKQTYQSSVTTFPVAAAVNTVPTIPIAFNSFNFQGGFIGANSWDFYIKSATWGGASFPLLAGDEIAIFDDVTDIMVGVLVLNQAITGSNPLQDVYKLTAYSKLADESDGFIVGHSPYLRVLRGLTYSDKLPLSDANYDAYIGSLYMGLTFPPSYEASVLKNLAFTGTHSYSTSTVGGTIHTSLPPPTTVDGADVSVGGLHTVCDALGAYSIGGLWIGNQYEVKASKPSVGSAKSGVFTLTISTPPIDLSLDGFPGSLTGKVMLKGIGAGIPDVTVTAVGPVTYTLHTNSGGDYTIKEAVAGTYVITAVKDNFVTNAVNNVVVVKGVTTTANIELSYNSPYSLANTNYDPQKIWTLYLSEATIDGSPLQAGDMIAFYSVSTSNYPCGIYTLTEPLNSSQATSHPLTAFAYVATATTGSPTVIIADEFPGWNFNDTYTFQCFDFSKGTYGDLKTVSIVPTTNSYNSNTNCPGVYDKFSVVKLQFVTTKGALTGNVYDGTSNPVNQPLAGVTVTAAISTHTCTGTTVTDAAGHYELFNLIPNNYPSETYSVVFSLPGRTTQTASCNITAAGTTIVNMTMSASGFAKTQKIALKPGINWVSSNVNPSNASMLDVVNTRSQITDGELDFVKNSAGAFTYYNGTWVNDIGNWIPTEGYVFKMDQTFITGTKTLTVAGTLMDPTTAIPLTFTTTSNPKFISFLPESPMDADHAFDLIKDKLVSVRNSAGKMFWIVNSAWVNNIGNLKPGEAYLVQVNADVNFTYPISKSMVEELDNTATHYLVSGNPANNVYTIYLQFSGFNAGDEIAVLDGNTVVGATKLVNGGEYNNPVAIFSTLANGNGYKVGDRIDIKAWDASANKEYFVNYTMLPKVGAYTGLTFPSGDHVISFANVVRVPAGVNDNADVTFEIYPNPAHDYMRIVANSEISKVSLLNVLGQTVLERTINAKETRLDIGGTQPGVYIVKLEADGKTVTQKVFVK